MDLREQDRGLPYANDENLCIIRGNRAIAEAYTAHVLDVVNHFNWRAALNAATAAQDAGPQRLTELACCPAAHMRPYPVCACISGRRSDTPAKA